MFVSSHSATDTKLHDRRASRSASKADDKAKTDRDHSLLRQRYRELKVSLGVDSHRSSSATRQGYDHTVRRANVKVQPDDASSDDSQSLAEVISPPPTLGYVEYNKTNPMPSDTLL